MDTEKILKLLNDYNVKYVIIGATAFPVHGYIRSTLDIDIFIESNINNASNTLEALKKFGYDVTDISISEMLNKKILIRQYMVEVDIHPFVKGVTFDEVWQDKVQSEYGNTKIYFASLKSLIKMKQAAKRPKDLEDLKYLNSIQKKEISKVG